MSERQVGRVVSVDNFRVFIRLDDDLTSSYKSGFKGLYEVARINSYLIIPVGADRIVALITRVKMQEEPEFDTDKHSITLPSSARYVTATMLGTIEHGDKSDRFIQGVYNFPVLDNPVWYVTEEDLNRIFDYKPDDTDINYQEDFYLPIGKSPAFPDYDVKICPDQLFVKHAAILGNTGSGKSCTLASILHSLFDYQYPPEEGKKDKRYLNNAHFIIFDTNGEYKSAFIDKEGRSEKGELFHRINALHIDEKGLKVPYWFMNWDDFDYLFDPGPGTQAPILKRAIGLGKNNIQSSKAGILDRVLESTLNEVINLACGDEEWKFEAKRNDKNKRYDPNNEIIQLSNLMVSFDNQALKDLARELSILGKENLSLAQKSSSIKSIESIYSNYKENIASQNIVNDKNIDLPTWFEYQKLITQFIDAAIDEHEGSNSKLSEYVSTLRLRLEGFLSDRRFAEPLLLNSKEEFDNSLSLFLSFIIGDMYRYFVGESQDTGTFDPFISYYSSPKCEKETDQHRVSQITILDLSLISYDVLENIVGLIGRLVIEFVSHFKPDDRGKYPIVLILEEAQNYIPEKDRKEKESIAKKVFERIAREGRKYGISLIVSSQRPSELSKTVLSQCNSFIVHRLQNPDDQKYVRGLVSSANSDILDQLPILPQQHAIVMGDCVRTAVQVKINTVFPKPNSNNPRFVETWLNENKDFPDYKKVCEAWQKGIKDGDNKDD
jgi:DNA helicase HerA-like ATPase